jgi:flagellar biosynthesis protein FliQ
MKKRNNLQLELKKSIIQFKDFSKNVIIGVIGGLISGVFFAVFSDLKTQIEGLSLFFVSAFVAFVWTFLFISLIFLYYILKGVIRCYLPK